MIFNRKLVTCLSAALVAGGLSAAQAPQERANLAKERVLNNRYALGLDQNHDLNVVRHHADEKGSHTRMQQTFCGVKVWGGEIIAHEEANGRRHETNALRQNVRLSVHPTLKGKEALAVVHEDLQPKGPYAYEPTVELVVYPNENGTHSLAYYVHTQIELTNDTRHTDYIVDAHSGEIIKKWNSMRTSDATGTANTQYSGTVQIHTNLNGSTYELYDVYRPMNIKTYNLNHATSGTGTLYTDADNTWGDGNNYPKGTGTSTTGATGQTTAVDAHYGIEVTYDFYKNVLGRNGIDGANKATYSRVHYSTSYDNAFWDDSCFCMTYGDGSSFKSLTALDVAAHEMSHGVCASEANLNYSGEPGGLNESNSDIFGAAVEIYSRNGRTLPATVPNTDAGWTMGEQLSSTPLRYMYKPSKDGTSPDYWSSSTGGLNVHYSSGPNNHMFFFLSQGASNNSSSDYYSSKAPNGFTGIGIEKAVKIWYKALADYMTTSTNYAGARTACLNACSALYGTTGAEYAAVQNAYGAIAVGALAPTGVTIAVSPTTATVVSATTKQFTATVSGSTNTSVTWTCTGGSISTSGLYTAPTVTANTNYTITATSAADTTKKATATVTVTPAGGVTITVSPTSATITSGGTQQFTASVSGSTNTSVTWTATGGSISTSGLFTAPTVTATTSYTVTATSAADTTKKATATVTVNPIGGGTEKILNGGFESGATSWSGSTGTIGNWSTHSPAQAAYQGSYCAWLGGNGSATTETLYQSVAIPSTAASATLTFYLHIDTAETTTSSQYDKMSVKVRNSSGTVLATLATYSNLNKAAGYTQKSFDLSAYKGQTVQVFFTETEDSSLQTSFVLDNISLIVK